ncbi:hypothetical protein BV898_18926 [Hypsibius exemplaris]|uniref:Uncharacterized protein n=1 Tax=Hypsibius exemplaris TaxID=2072580 RepID=A0A9X6NKS4_HYPEX|nr:hypothetical protein BV898_18926 [Hypsibius exemplaris]
MEDTSNRSGPSLITKPHWRMRSAMRINRRDRRTVHRASWNGPQPFIAWAVLSRTSILYTATWGNLLTIIAIVRARCRLREASAPPTINSAALLYDGRRQPDSALIVFRAAIKNFTPNRAANV